MVILTSYCLVVVKNINYTWFSLYDLFVTLGGEGRTLEKKTDEREMEGKIVTQLEWIDLFFFILQSPPMGELKKCIGGLIKILQVLSMLL
jgi:hypothetical protein